MFFLSKLLNGSCRHVDCMHMVVILTSLELIMAPAYLYPVQRVPWIHQGQWIHGVYALICK